MKTDEKALQRIVSRLEKSWQNTASEAIKRLYELLDSGKKVDVAVDSLRKEFPGLFTLPDIKSAMVEAAAYGYGIVPSVLTATQIKNWQRDLSKSWQSDGMNLSKRLHGADVKMRNAIIDTIREQMKRNATWTTASRALYDGYNADKVVRVQELPQYLKVVRRATQGSVEHIAAARKAINNIKNLAQKGAPTKSLKAAYSEMVNASLLGTQEQLEKACWVAIQEKSRYVADRIIRTELARAWGDGFIAKIMDDEDVVAVRWKLGTRHPVFDICDMYAKADMYKLGAGIYPKDKLPPYPAHPHCLCRMVEVFVGEVDLSKAEDNIQEAGNKWLNGLNLVQRQRVLGIAGNKAWADGEDWRKFMNGWQGLQEPETRLKHLFEKNLIPPTDKFIKSIADKYGVEYNIGKIGADRFYDENGDPIYPPNGGFVGTPKIVTLKAGTKLVDRYGRDSGSFVSPVNTPLEARALPKMDAAKLKEYHVYEIIKDVENVQAGITAPWFGEVGGGTQYKLPKAIKYLCDYLKEVDSNDVPRS